MGLRLPLDPPERFVYDSPNTSVLSHILVPRGIHLCGDNNIGVVFKNNNQKSMEKLFACLTQSEAFLEHWRNSFPCTWS